MHFFLLFDRRFHETHRFVVVPLRQSHERGHLAISHRGRYLQIFERDLTLQIGLEACRVLPLKRLEAPFDLFRRQNVTSFERLHRSRQQQKDIARRSFSHEVLDGKGERVPCFSFDHVTRSHVRKCRFDSRRRHVALSDRPDSLDALSRFRELTPLQLAILHPRKRMKVSPCIGEPAALRPLYRSLVGALVRPRDFFPLAELHEDMRRHVERVLDIGRDLRETVSSVERERRVKRVDAEVSKVMSPICACTSRTCCPVAAHKLNANNSFLIRTPPSRRESTTGQNLIKRSCTCGATFPGGPGGPRACSFSRAARSTQRCCWRLSSCSYERAFFPKGAPLEGPLSLSIYAALADRYYVAICSHSAYRGAHDALLSPSRLSAGPIRFTVAGNVA